MPSTLKITYLDSTNNRAVLGFEEAFSISELPYPAAERCQHVMTITKIFDGQDCHRWKVCSVHHPNPTDIEILLEPRKGAKYEVFLYKTIKNQRFNIQSSLRKGTLIEVDFGFIYSVKKASGLFGTCKRYVDQPSKGEMHKRRLAIVVKASRERVQVVPITSQTPLQADSHTSFALDNATLAPLINYNNPIKNSYAIAGMIQSVSPTRVLPPRTLDRRGFAERDTRYRYRLSTPELQEFERCLANAVGLSDLLHLKENLRLEKVAHEAALLELDRLRGLLAGQPERVRELEGIGAIE